MIARGTSQWFAVVDQRLALMGGTNKIKMRSAMFKSERSINVRLLSSKPTTTTTPATTTTATSTSVTTPPSMQPKFYIPRSERSSPTSIYDLDSIYDQRIKRRRRIDPTRELFFTDTHWERHKSVYRRIKHMLTTLGSSPFQRLLFPDLFVSSVVAGGLTYYNEFLVSSADVSSQICMDGSGLAAGTTAIALLTGFRLNASYGRYNEGRKMLSSVNTASRNLATNTLMWITAPKGRERMLKLIKAYSVALTFHLNKKGAHHGVRRCDANFQEQIYAEYRAEMKDVFNHRHHHHNNNEQQEHHDPDFVRVCKWYQNKDNVPLGITSLMKQIISNNDQQKDALNRELDLHVQKLVEALGGCERIQKTPIPTCFTRHTSRLLFCWSVLMPFAIYPTCGPLFTLPSTVAISYSIMGIEDIG